MTVHIASSRLPEAQPGPQLGSACSSTGLRSAWKTGAWHWSPLRAAPLLTECLIPGLSSQARPALLFSTSPAKKVVLLMVYRHRVHPPHLRPFVLCWDGAGHQKTSHLEADVLQELPSEWHFNVEPLAFIKGQKQPDEICY